jgi:hypothetical protein
VQVQRIWDRRSKTFRDVTYSLALQTGVLESGKHVHPSTTHVRSTYSTPLSQALPTKIGCKCFYATKHTSLLRQSVIYAFKKFCNIGRKLIGILLDILKLKV